MAANSWLNPRPILYFILIPLLSASLPIPAIAQTQPPLFPIANSLPIGAVSTPAIGDFNGDGQPDLIYSPPPTPTPSQQFATLTVLLNQDAANPTPIVTSSLTCTSVTSLMVADMNNDKKLDVALTCIEGFVAILFGNGDGTFQKPSYYAVSGAKALITPTDLNDDGYLDIVVSTQAGPVVLLNQGSSAPGILGSPTTFPGVPQTTFTLIGVGDFNGDGKPDILAGGTQFALYLGNGDGTFQPPQTPSVPAGTRSPVIADLNHDGISDVVYLTADPSPGITQTVQVLLGNSSGQFTVGSSLSLDPSTNYTSLALAGSINNNGVNINLALGGPATTILLGDSKGGFTVGQTYAIAGSPLQETAGNGNSNLVFFTSTGVTQIPGNGDGTFQGLPTLPVGLTGFVAADFNGDGLTDVVSISATGNLVTALGRGNGTFLVTNQTPSPASANQFLVAGDFNADGHPDVVEILPAPTAQGVVGDSQLFFYKGNGDGSFQSTTSTGIDLHITGAVHAVTGDFNGDGHLDLVISSYATDSNQPSQSLTFLPGNGDGTFGTPVTFSTLTPSGSPSSLLLADLNDDGKPDLAWSSSVYLGNGDGTFRQQPLSIVDTPSTIGGFNGPLAIGDVNGDGIPDIVVQPPSTSGFAVYAGLGDGTFQTTPLFTVPTLPSGAALVSALIGDVNADGHPDLLVEIQNPDLTAEVNVYLGDGKGNFTADTNTYTAGGSIEGRPAMESPIASFARLNNQAPALTNDNAPDFLTFTSGGATSLLNQLNPPPTAPSLIPSSTTLAISAPTANINQQLILTATVTGANPTGAVTFISGNTTLGTAILSRAAATLPVSFAAVGAYSIIANYSGDNANLPSTSNTLSITITIPDFTLTADRITQLVNRGQPVTTTVTIAPLNGYNGAVNLSCTALPAETSCAFAPSSLSPSSGAASTATLTITTTAPTAASAKSQPHSLRNPLPPILWAGIVCLALSPKRLWRSPLRRSLFTLVLLGSLLTLTACSSSPAGPTVPPNPGTPTGIQSITITAADSAGGPSHSISLQLTVQ